jgi:hypothetical protein
VRACGCVRANMSALCLVRGGQDEKRERDGRGRSSDRCPRRLGQKVLPHFSFVSCLCFACGLQTAGRVLRASFRLQVSIALFLVGFPMYAVNAAVSVCTAVSHVPVRRCYAWDESKARHGRVLRAVSRLEFEG